MSTTATTATPEVAAAASTADASAPVEAGGAVASGADASDDDDDDLNTGWLPLESNPDIVNPFAHAMGLPKEWAFCDILGLEDWAFDMVPKPVAAVVLLFASSDKARAFKKAQHASIVEKGQEVDPGLFYLTQVDGIGNACGTIACIHALLNGHGPHFQLAKSPVTEFAKATAALTPLDRGKALLTSAGLREISDTTASNEAASTECPEASEAVNAHFIAFVERGGVLFELDGRKAFPINHGPCAPEALLPCAAKVIQRDFMAVNPTEVRFNMMALAMHGAAAAAEEQQEAEVAAAKTD